MDINLRVGLGNEIDEENLNFSITIYRSIYLYFWQKFSLLNEQVGLWISNLLEK